MESVKYIRGTTSRGTTSRTCPGLILAALGATCERGPPDLAHDTRNYKYLFVEESRMEEKKNTVLNR